MLKLNGLEALGFSKGIFVCDFVVVESRFFSENSKTGELRSECYLHLKTLFKHEIYTDTGFSAMLPWIKQNMN